MPIFDQGYQHWDGHLSGHTWRWLAIARQGVRAQLRKRAVKWTVVGAISPALGLAAALILWSMLEQGSNLLDPIRPILDALPAEIRDGPRTFRRPFWTMAFDLFFRVETFLAMILVATVGPDLISQDLRFNAMPLYFSRPVRRIDYFLGKLGVIGFFLGLVIIAPAVGAYLLGLAFSFEASVLRDTGPLLLGAIGYGLVVIVSGGLLMLAISSITRNSRFVAAIWVGVWIVSVIGAKALVESVGRDWCPVVSYTRDLHRIREAMLGTQAARDEFLGLAQRTQDAARVAAVLSRPSSIFLLPPRRPLEPIPPFVLEADSYPWTWSAGVLVGLAVLSIVVLSRRVRSLDRLK